MAIRDIDRTDSSKAPKIAVVLEEAFSKFHVDPYRLPQIIKSGFSVD